MISLKKENENILTLVFENKDLEINLINESFLTHLETLIEEVTRDETTHGLIIYSNKRDFLSGVDLEMYLNERRPSDIYKLSKKFQKILRQLENWNKPVVAALNGNTLGAGLELALACNYRVAIGHPKIKLGLPEVNYGIMPGGGGTQRVTKLMGLEEGLNFLLNGEIISPKEAKEKSLVHKLVKTKQELIEEAKAFIEQNPNCIQPWDAKETKYKSLDKNSFYKQQFFSKSSALLTEKFRGKGSSTLYILKSVYEGSILGIDAGCEVEAQYFGHLFSNPKTKNIINTNFFGVKKCKNLRNDLTNEIEPIKKIGIIGVGIMGQGISEISARSGIEVIMIDRDLTSAEIGKNNISKSLDKLIQKGKLSKENKNSILARIETRNDISSFNDCDIVIECIYENSNNKKEILKNIEKNISEDTIIATNTSSISIDSLATDLKHKDRFLGIHFFSPVQKMNLVEIVKGKETENSSVIKALKFVKDLSKIPILVRDGQGFFTTRVFTSYIAEALNLIHEGYAPALVENASRILGFPKGPLEIADEISLPLIKSVFDEKLKFNKLSDFFNPSEKIAYDIIKDFIEVQQREGKRSHKGFYDYTKPNIKNLSSSIRSMSDPSKDDELEVCKERLMAIQQIEALKCYEEGIINTAHEGDIASILGWGFPFQTGGIINLCHQEGNQELLEKFMKLKSLWGERFSPPKILKALINKNFQTLHEAREILPGPLL